MKTSKQITQIKNTLMNGNCIFTVKGLEAYQELDNGEYSYGLQHLQVSKCKAYVTEINTLGIEGQMNISKFTKKTMRLFTYSILNNKVKGKINYNDVTIIQVIK